MALILYRVMRQRLKAAGHSASPEMALAQLRRIQRQSISINQGVPIGGISNIHRELCVEDYWADHPIEGKMLPRKITFGGGDALVSRSYQAKTGKVRTGKPRTAGLSVLLTDPSLREVTSEELGSEG